MLEAGGREQPSDNGCMASGADNAAQRLHDLLLSIHTTPDSASGTEAWAQALGIEPTDVTRLMTLVGGIAKLPDQIAAAVRELGLDEQLFLTEWRTQVDAALAGLTNLQTSIDGVKRQFNEGTLVSLRHTAHQLQVAVPRFVPPDDALQALAAELDALAESIVTAQIEPAVKGLLLHHLNHMIEAVRGVRAFGVDGLVAAVDEAVGAYVTQRPDTAEDAETRSWVARVYAKVGNLATLLTTANAGWQIADHVQKMIGG
jgi:hypothetical protein